MARKFLTPIDLSQLEIQNARAQNLASAPSAPVTGQFYFNTTSNRLLWYNGSAWVNVGTDSDLLQGNNSAYHLSRANHTGTQTVSTLSDLTSTLNARALSSFAGANASNLPMNGYKLTGLAAGSAAGDSVEYTQFNNAIAGVSAGLDWKEDVTVVVTTNVNLASPGTTLAGHTMVAGDTFLAAGQSTASQNGIYNWNGASTAATRRSDAAAAGNIRSGTMVPVGSAGTTSPDTVWMQTATGTGANGAITIGTDSQSWSNPFAATPYSAGNSGISIASYAISAVAGTGLTISSGIALDLSGTATQKVSQRLVGVIPTATAAPFTVSGAQVTINHNFNNYAAQAVVRSYTTPATGQTAGQRVEVDDLATDANNIQLTLPAAPAANNYYVSVEG